ncbi:fiber [Trifolium repens]|nr:fiber [Trifolium repens]
MASSLLLAVVFVFDLIAFALAVAAEQRRSTANLAQNIEGRKYCQYDSDIATGLGVGSLFILVASQVIIMVVTRCLCCGKAMRPSGSRSWAICLFITTWLTFLIAASCLLAGSVRNAYHTKYRDLLGERAPSCQTLRKGVFGAGAAFIVLTGIISELYYVSFSKANNSGALPYARDTGVTMSNF